MPLSIEALLERPAKERTGNYLSMNAGPAFWKMRSTFDPTTYLSPEQTSGFSSSDKDKAKFKPLVDAISYWTTAGEFGEFSFLKLKDGVDNYFVNLVKVQHSVDDEAPIDATHKAFVQTSEHAKAKISIEFVRLDLSTTLGNRCLEKPKPNRVPAPSQTLEVWEDGAYVTKTSEEMEAFIKDMDAQRGDGNVKRCVNMMQRGGKYTMKYAKEPVKDVLHASKGRRGDSGTCSVFYVDYLNKVRLIGIGHHTGNASYSISWCEKSKVGPVETPVLPSSIALE